MKIGSLFSGIGGLELGLEWAGLGETVFQVEKEEYARKVLARHWPAAIRFDNVCSVGKRNLPSADILCGGFPCQDLSYAGEGAGLAGERSGLWSEYKRIICEIRPQFVIVENVAALLSRGLGSVLGDLAASGYDAFWDCISASMLGFPHERDRLFIVAYPMHKGLQRHGSEYGLQENSGEIQASGSRGGTIKSGMGRGLDGFSDWLDRGFVARPEQPRFYWEPERSIMKMKGRTPRLKALGNAVCPQVGYYIGKLVIDMLENEGI